MGVLFDGLCFIDTNIWLYAFISSQDKWKNSIASQVISDHDIIVSTQVVNEISVNLLRKADVCEQDIRKLIRSFYARYEIIGLDEILLLNASDIRTRLSLSFWDSLIVTSALHGGANFLITEDMQHNQLIDGTLRVINPFKQ